MNIFKKIFNLGKKERNYNAPSNQGKYMPDPNIPIDEKFTIHFKKNGGKFLYCESLAEIYTALENIVSENKWQNESFYYIDNSLPKKLATDKIPLIKDKQNSIVFFTSCEYLVAQDGSILICANQIGEKKLNELPDNFIVFATTSQITNTIGEGLKGIKNRSKKHIPTNISTIKQFETSKENDFLTYGSSSKNLYLLLLEDL